MTAIAQDLFLAYVRGVLRECPTEGERSGAIVTAHGALRIMGGMTVDEAEAAVERELGDSGNRAEAGAAREPAIVSQSAPNQRLCSAAVGE